MASFRKTGEKWRAEIRRQGHKPMSKVFPTKRQAQSWARGIEEAIEKGDLHHLSNKTVRDAIEKFIDETEPTTYQQTTLNWWKQELGRLKLSHIRKAHVIEARKKLAKSQARVRKNDPPRLISPATVNRRVALLSKVFRIAIEEWDWCRDNPCHVRALSEDNERDRLLSDQEQANLMAALKAHTEPSLYPFVMTALYTGMRASEVQRIMWRDIDLETGHVQILKTKNGEKRSVVVGGEALALLKERRREVGLKAKGYVFFNSTTNKAPYNYRAHWSEAKKAAGVSDFRFHDLRHAFTTQALKAGMNPVMVQLVTGHKSSHMLKRYSHLTTDVAAQVSASVVASQEKGDEG